MHLSPLTAIGPLDGRYRNKVAALAPYFSEFALIKYRVKVEVLYFIALHKLGISPLGELSEETEEQLHTIYTQFSEENGLRIKAIERETNHDVKAVEYFIKEEIEKGIDDETLINNLEFVHFGLTSQDINNTAMPMMLRDGMQTVLIPQLDKIIQTLSAFAAEWKAVPMLARTHGQAATPTTLGKEIQVFATRLSNQLDILKDLDYPAKFGGASGNLNAHYLAYPDIDWQNFANKLVVEMGLSRSFPTTQIEHYDGLGRIFDCLKRINTILIDLCQDMWMYISIEYFRQKVKKGEVGSSAMPHKVNPIDFENAEGNCGLSTALLEFLSRKLPISRWQRDLTDSTISRNFGLGLGYTYLALLSLEKGLGKLLLNPAALARDLDQNWAVLAEAIQTILRREGYPKPYEALRDFTRGNQAINAETLAAFVESLDVSSIVKAELLTLRPETYLGNAPF